VLRSLAATPTARVAAALVAGSPGRLLQPAAWRSLAAYAHLRRRLVLSAVGGPAGALAEVQGYRAGFLCQVDALVRPRVAAIFATHFTAESAAAYSGSLARSAALGRWIAAPLTAPTRTAAASQREAAA